MPPQAIDTPDVTACGGAGAVDPAPPRGARSRTTSCQLGSPGCVKSAVRPFRTRLPHTAARAPGSRPAASRTSWGLGTPWRSSPGRSPAFRSWSPRTGYDAGVLQPSPGELPPTVLDRAGELT